MLARIHKLLNITNPQCYNPLSMAEFIHGNTKIFLPNRTREPQFTENYPFGQDQITCTHTKSGLPVCLGIDHNEDVLATEHQMRRFNIKQPMVGVLVDAHSDILVLPDRVAGCHPGTWIVDAARLGQLNLDIGLYWLYRRFGAAPPDFNGRSMRINDFQKSKLRVNVICIDSLLNQEPEAVTMLHELENIAKAGNPLKMSLDWDAGIYADTSFPLRENESMGDYLKRVENLRVFDLDLMKQQFMKSLLGLAGFVNAFRSPDYCNQAYAIYQEQSLLAS